MLNDFDPNRTKGTDEYVIIKRGEDGALHPPDPRGGEMGARLDDRIVPLPLKHTDVDAHIMINLGTVHVTQQYHNPYAEKIEAVYRFPLPQNAAIRDFLMTIGDRTIRGIIREKEEAERIYREARRQGYVASLMTQNRPNIFTQSVANIEPGKQIDISITYFHTLKYDAGEYEFAFPMVIGPRFNPAGTPAPIRPVAADAPPSSDGGTDIRYRRPDDIPANEIALRLQLDAGVPIERISSANHVLDLKRPGPTKAEIRLATGDRIPNKDFVLRWRVAADKVSSAIAVTRTDAGNHFLMTIQPPRTLDDIPAPAREMIFVLDCSGSMRGDPIEAAKRSMRWSLRRLDPRDSFQIIRFSNNASALGHTPLPATRDNVRKGLAYIDSLSGGGGTQMIEGIKAALDFPHDPSRRRIVSFMTDGFIGNETDIIGAIKQKLGASRIFSFGVGSSPNRYLLERMAKVGRGVCTYVGLNDESARAAEKLYQWIEHPALSDLSIDWGNMSVSDVHPSPLPDLMAGRPITLCGRFEGNGPQTIRVTGTMGNGRHTFEVPIDLNQPTPRGTSLAALWARARISDFRDQMTFLPPAHRHELAGEIRDLALNFGLMSGYTSFIAVDSSRRTEGRYGTTVEQPVPVPDGVRYDTTVEEK